MSLDLINHKLTTSTTDKNGVIWWNNPAVLVKINSKGEVYDNNGNKVKPYNGVRKRYRIDMSNNGVCFKHPTTFKSLFSRIVLGVKLGGANTFVLKDATKGFIENNVEIVTIGTLGKGVMKSNLSKYIKVISLHKDGLTAKEISNVVGVTTITIRKWIKEAEGTDKQDYQSTYNSSFKETPKQLVLESTQEDVSKGVSMSINTTDNTTKQFYTLYEAKNEHTTEDGAVFPTKELAEWHQTKVTKGKGNAQVVLDYNGGYVLAEQIYLQEVVYNKAKPYTNFIDVLNNNQGIASVVQEEHCKFDKLDNEHGLSPVQLNLFGLDKVINLSCTKVQAEKINTSLNKYSEAFSKLEDEHKTLKDLLKQVS